ncbi:MAG: hypothetical protein JRJ04_12920 [Deltaproteobacteria bacterium]|nr:hypothetical protein [Deltaproteobacteria bacterium]
MESRIHRTIFLVLLAVLLLVPVCNAAIPVARISGFEGEVFVLTDAKILRVEQIGHVLNEGDRVQTREGRAEITFDDGAVLNLWPFTNTQIQVKEEKTGFWIFKARKTVRRITLC